MFAIKSLSLLLLAAAAVAATPFDTYRSRWQDPAVQEKIDRNIERYRKGDARVEIVDSNGQPLAGARVSFRQVSHQFLFGCNAFVLGQLPTPEKNRQYEEAFTRIFNFATVPFYWEGTEPKQGELRYEEPASDMWRRPPPERYIAWGARNGITLKGHPLVWHAYNPTWLPKDGAELRRLYQKRFREIASRFADKIPVWDVVNESLISNKDYPLFDPSRSYVRWAFQEVEPLFPKDTQLLINEIHPFNFAPIETNRYIRQLEVLLSRRVPIRGIGLQYHFITRPELDKYMSTTDSDPKKLLSTYDTFCEFGLPFYITEITFGSAGVDGEAIQEQIVRDHYRLWFSVPRMTGITWWNLGDGTAIKIENGVNGGLLDADLKPKAAYRALDRLINHEWKTSGETSTSAAGLASFRGFYGRYKIDVTVGSETRSFEINLASGKNEPHRLQVK